jgi:hypothetical protein
VKEFKGFIGLQPKINFKVFIGKCKAMKKSRDLFEMFNIINQTNVQKPVETKVKYKTVGAKSLMEAFRLNGFSIDRKNDATAKTTFIDLSRDTELTEEISYKFEDKGGIIVFSVNVNAVQLSTNKVVRVIKNALETFKNKLFKDRKINKVISQHADVYGVTIGRYVQGRYKSDNGSMYDESSLSIEIIGITSDVLNKVAEDLAKEFLQETVLVKDYASNRIYLVKLSLFKRQ